jgi:hypothetical protein
VAKASAEPKDLPAERKPSKLRWLLGWVLIPGSIIALLFLAGVHVGARHPGMWLSRLTLWALDAEPQLGPANAEERQVLARRLWRLAVPGKEHSLHVTLSQADVEAYAKLAKIEAEALDCKRLCELIYEHEEEDKELLEITRCVVEEDEADERYGKLECDARIER